MYAPGSLAVGAVLEPAQGGRTGQRRIPTHRSLKTWVLAQLSMVVEVFVAQRQGKDPLPEHGLETVGKAVSPPRIRQAPGHIPGQAQAPIRLAQQDGPAIAGDVPAAKRDLNFPAGNPWQIPGLRSTFRHGETSRLFSVYPTEI